MRIYYALYISIAGENIYPIISIEPNISFAEWIEDLEHRDCVIIESKVLKLSHIKERIQYFINKKNKIEQSWKYTSRDDGGKWYTASNPKWSEFCEYKCVQNNKIMFCLAQRTPKSNIIPISYTMYEDSPFKNKEEWRKHLLKDYSFVGEIHEEEV